MADAAAVKHDYHLVKPSPWPLLGAIAMLAMFLGIAGYMKGFWFIAEGRPGGDRCRASSRWSSC